MTIKPDTISEDLKTEIRTKLVAQLLRWDQGQTQELFDKKLFGEREKEVKSRVQELIGHHITDKPITLLFGRKEYQDVFSWVPASDIPKGFMVSIVQAKTGTLRDKVSFPIDETAVQAVEQLRGVLSGVIAFARDNKVKGLKTLKTPFDNRTDSAFTAATAEDFVNGMNVVLDKDLQINTELLRGQKR